MPSSQRFARILLFCGVLLLAGCATPQQTTINLPTDYFSSKTDRLGVALAPLPTPDTQFPGADCLLCLATASLMNSTLTNSVKQWPTADMAPVQAEVAELLRAQGQSVLVLDEPLKIDSFPDRPNKELGFSAKDFSALKAKVGIDRLLVISVHTLGVLRSFNGYIPSGPPIARADGVMYLVDLNTHKLELFETVGQRRGAQGAWDEPPKFPGLTNAYFETLEATKDAIKKPFSK